jgi:hypothetical protein
MANFSTEYIITPKVRLAFPNLVTGKANKQGKVKYGCVLLADKKECDIKALKELVKQVVANEFGGKPVPPSFKLGIKDGDVPNGNGNIPNGYKGCWVINCSSNYPVGLVDEKVQRVLDEKKFYPGCYVVAQVNAFPFNTDGNRGCGFGVANIQFAGDGERLGGGAPDPTTAFAPVPGSAAASGGNGDSPDDFLNG